MKILSWNVNGLRSVYRKGFLEWLTSSAADIVCLQETKARKEQLPFDLTRLTDYRTYFSSAQKKGYSGVAVYTRNKPLDVKDGIGLSRFDSEGRVLRLDFKDFILLNLYLPHGGHQKENLGYKLDTYDYLLGYLGNLKEEKIVLAGDFNVAHQEIDLAHPRKNKDNIMFTKKERQKITKLINLGFTDSFRKFNKEGGNYSWWPYGYNARERNLGWRIDYIFTSISLTPKLRNAEIYPEVTGSDHCPVGLSF